MRRLGASLCLWLALTPATAPAQSYPSIRPEPRTTDAQRMQSDARRREVAERIARAFDLELRGDWQHAVPELQRAIALDPGEPQNSTAHYDLALAQAHLGDLDAARMSLRAAIAKDPDFIAARVNLVAIDLMRDDLPSARRDADELVARAPQSARALYEHGLTALRSGDATTALNDFGVLLARNPAYATARYDFALAELKLGRLGDAERDLRSALALAPGFARARFALGAVLLREGHRDEARAAFDEAARASQDPSLRDLALQLRDTIAR